MEKNLNAILLNDPVALARIKKKNLMAEKKEISPLLDNLSLKSKKKVIFEKYNGHCAYCGIELKIANFDVDHIIPKYLGGSNKIENLNPSCRRCNSWKKTFSIEEFRNEIMAQPERLLRNSASVRLAADYGIIEIKNTGIKPKFYFEKILTKLL